MKVLAVDDDKTAKLIYECIAERYGFDVIVVDSAESALAAVKTVQFDVILMDWQLAGQIDGLTCTGMMRTLQREQQRYVPIVAVTANAMPEHKKLCLDAGMDDYLSKPFQMDELNRMIDKWGRRILRFRKTGS